MTVQHPKHYLSFFAVISCVTLSFFPLSAKADTIQLANPIQHSPNLTERVNLSDSIERIGSVHFDVTKIKEQLVSARSAGADTYDVTLFADKAVSFHFTSKNHQGTSVIYTGRTQGSLHNNVSLVMTGKHYVLLIDEAGVQYDVFGQRGNGQGQVKQIDTSRRAVKCGLSEDMRNFSTVLDRRLSTSRPEITTNLSALAPETLATFRQVTEFKPATTATIDMLFAYDRDAQEWINQTRGGDFEAYTLQVQTKLNQFMENNRLNIRFNVVHWMTVDSTTFVSEDQTSFSYGRVLSGFNPASQYSTAELQTVTQARRNYHADLVAYFAFDQETQSAGTTGLANLLTNPNGVVDFAYSVSAVDQAVGTTLIHEIGHNFGASHAREQGDAPNQYIGEYAAGWYINDAYNTIMAYNFVEHSDNTKTVFSESGLFSSPDLTFESYPTGDVTQADNRRVMYDSAPVIEQYQTRSNTLPTYTIDFLPSTNGLVTCDFTQPSSADLVTCKAVANEGYEFDSWTGICQGVADSPYCQFVTNKDVDIGGTFTKQSDYLIRTFDTENGSLVCDHTSGNLGDEITCIASPSSGYEIAQWQGACQNNAPAIKNCIFPLAGDSEVGVTFQPHGEYSSSPIDVKLEALTYGGSFSCSFANPRLEGTEMTCTIQNMVSGYRVAQWGGACASNYVHAQSCTFFVDPSNPLVEVSFAQGAVPTPIATPPRTDFFVIVGNVENGKVSCNQSTVSGGDSVTCKATPDTGYQLSSWFGACSHVSSNESTCQLTITNDVTIDAFFTKSTHDAVTPTLFNVATLPTQNGSLVCDPPSVTANSVVTCTANPNTGYRVASWSGSECASLSNHETTCTFSVTTNTTIGVMFEPKPVAPTQFTINTTQPQNGTLSCNESLAVANTPVTCKANPNAGYRVANWLGSECASLSNHETTCTFSVTTNTTIGVMFEPEPVAPSQFTINTTQPQNGTLSCNETQAVTNTPVTCTANPNTGYRVASWSGSECSMLSNHDISCAFNVTKSTTIGVMFEPEPVAPTLFTINTTSPKNGTLSCNETLAVANTTLICTANPKSGYRVASWSGSDCDSLTNHETTCTFSVTKSTTIGVIFEEISTAPKSGFIFFDDFEG